VASAIDEIADFLMNNLYRSPRVMAAMEDAQGVVVGLLEAYRADPLRLPARHQRRYPEAGKILVIADYVAGMTDRFALAEYRRITGS
jgi:dGTPase